MLVEMSFTVMMTKGTKTACAKRVKRVQGESRGSLTIAAQTNMIRIDFLRSQIAHVLRANMTKI
jgi:hypothetical protein